MSTIRAIFENGVFRPLDPVLLPERTRVTFDPELDEKTLNGAHVGREVLEILGRRFESGSSDTAARHDEHQP